MSTHERPSQTPEPPKIEEVPVKKITLEGKEQSDEHNEKLNQNVEKLIAEEVEARHDWTAKRREYMATHLRENGGQWRECEGVDIIFIGFYPDYETRRIEAVFEVFGMDMADDIPMPDWMHGPED